VRPAAFGLQPGAIVGRKPQRFTIIDRRQSAAEQHFPFQLQLFGRFIGRIDMAGRAQPVERCFIARKARRLRLLGVGSHAQPVEIRADRGREGWGGPGGIGIVHPQQEATAGLAGEQPVQKRGAHIADMKAPGGRWRKTGDDHGAGQ
jgi:hypothetical protein